MRMGNVTSIGEKAFVQCNALVELDFTKCDSVPALASTNAFDNYSLKNNPKILVPAELYGEWIAATNWAEYADYIVPVGQAPVIETPDYVSEGLLIENGVLKGRGACTDSVIVVPEEVSEIEMCAFNDDVILDTLILPDREVGVNISAYSVYNTPLRVVKNYYLAGSLTFRDLEYVSFLPNVNSIDGSVFLGEAGTVYDFSRHSSVPLLYNTDQFSVNEGARIYVPLTLYKEWKNDTNWACYADYIVAVR